MEDWMRKIRLAVVTVFILMISQLQAPFLISASDSKMALPSCDWTMAGKTTENIRVADDECGPERVSLERVWVSKTFYASAQPPVASDGKLYVCSYMYDVYCLDLKTGNTIWKRDIDDDGGYVDERPPIIVDEKLYIASDNGSVICLNANNGDRIWRFLHSTWFNSDMIFYEGKIMFMISDNIWKGPLLYCLDCNTGTPLWSKKIQSSNQAGLAISNGRIFVSDGISRLFCLDAKNGKEIWSVKLREQPFSNPCIYEDKIIINTIESTINCLNRDTGEILWQNKRSFSGQDWSSPTVYNGKVYVSTRSVDIKTGLTKWENDIDNPRSVCASFCNGRMFVDGLNAMLACFDANTGKILFCYGHKVGYQLVPIISDGFVFARCGSNYLNCFSDHKTNNSVRIELSAPSDTICTSEYVEIKARVFDADGNWIGNAPVDWSIKPDFAIVRSDGTVWSHQSCDATVTCRSNDLVQTMEIHIVDCQE